MKGRVSIAVLLSIAGFAGCAGPTPKGDPGHWTMTLYLCRNYQTDQKTAYDAAKKYFADKGYSSVEDNFRAKDSVLHGFAGPEASKQSLIIRTIRLTPDLTQVQFKAGPAYNMMATSAMMDEFQRLLPQAAQPK